MIDGFSESQIIGALVTALVASYAAFFGWIVASLHRLDRKIDAVDAKLSAQINALDAKLSAQIGAVDAKLGAQINGVDAKLSAQINAVDAKLSAQINALTIAVSRLEGAVYHGLPEPRESGTRS